MYPQKISSFLSTKQEVVLFIISFVQKQVGINTNTQAGQKPFLKVDPEERSTLPCPDKGSILQKIP